MYDYAYQQNSTVVFTVLAVDQGDPPRGDTAEVRLTLSNTCLMDTLYQETDVKILVEEDYGNLTLRIPKYYLRHGE